jgi:hypothetical protein
MDNSVRLATTAGGHMFNYALYSADEQIQECVTAGQAGDDLTNDADGPDPQLNAVVNQVAATVKDFGEMCAGANRSDPTTYFAEGPKDLSQMIDGLKAFQARLSQLGITS